MRCADGTANAPSRSIAPRSKSGNVRPIGSVERPLGSLLKLRFSVGVAFAMAAGAEAPAMKFFPSCQSFPRDFLQRLRQTMLGLNRMLREVACPGFVKAFFRK